MLCSYNRITEILYERFCKCIIITVKSFPSFFAGYHNAQAKPLFIKIELS